MGRTMREIWHGDQGATAVEYAIMIAGIALVIYAVVGVLGETLSQKFDDFNNSLGAAS